MFFVSVSLSPSFSTSLLNIYSEGLSEFYCCHYVVFLPFFVPSYYYSMTLVNSWGCSNSVLTGVLEILGWKREVMAMVAPPRNTLQCTQRKRHNFTPVGSQRGTEAAAGYGDCRQRRRRRRQRRKQRKSCGWFCGADHSSRLEICYQSLQRGRDQCRGRL